MRIWPLLQKALLGSTAKPATICEKQNKTILFNLISFGSSKAPEITQNSNEKGKIF